MLDKNFKDIISNIKEEIINTQIKRLFWKKYKINEIILWRICWWWKMATDCCQITLEHNLLLIEKIKDKDIRKILVVITLYNK